MIYLRITDLLLTAPLTHTSSDWQVAEDLQFTIITAQSLGDTINLTNILFNNQLDPAIKYYARSRVLLSTGYTAWSNIDVFSPQDIPDNSVNVPLPSIVTLPTVTITNSGTNVPIFGTTIDIAPVSTLGDAGHRATSYVLENINGNVVWDSLLNTLDKNRKVIPPNIMVPNTVYRLRILLHTDSNDSSQIITTTIKTAVRSKGLIINNLEGSDSAVDLVVEVISPTAISSIVGTLYGIVNNQSTIVNSYVGGGLNNNIITVPTADLKPATKYIMRVTTADPLIWDQRIFTTI